MSKVSCSIEVAALAEASTTERGGILESFATTFLESQNFKVVSQVRLTGMEVDLLAKHLGTEETVFVECKAHRKSIAAEALAKIVGNVHLKEANSGWMISTSGLTKDGLGWKHEWEQKTPEQRRKLQIDLPDTLITRLINANLVVDPDELIARFPDVNIGDALLVLTDRANFWALSIADLQTGIRTAVIYANAETGLQISDRETLEYLGSIDSSVADLEVHDPSEHAEELIHDQIRIDLQNIVPVPVAEHWADYRPARPQDFVGRTTLQDQLLGFFDRVRFQESETRLFSIKAPSGWGKSSLILKLIGRSREHRRKKGLFLFATDSRAATSDQFVDLAFIKLFNSAKESGFIPSETEVVMGPFHRPFATPEMEAICRSLKENNQLLVLVFDQFEELLFRPDLAGIFEKILRLCTAIDEFKENIAFGFSWKTDGTIPPEHPAYHLWHRLADRRFECDLTLFTTSEVTAALNGFEKELEQPLSPQLRRLLADQCQGYPWLLKKLCIHTLELERSESDQSQMVVRSLNVEQLFNQDLNGLDKTQVSCLKQIAQDSPAEFFAISEQFGEDTINDLLSRRLVVRSGPKLNIYWDIFREFLRSGRTPSIPVTYIPQANFSAYMKTLQFLRENRETTYEALAAHLNLAEGTADNIVRDLVMLGHAEANRRQSELVALFDDEEQIIENLVDFWSSHLLYQLIRANLLEKTTVTKDEIAGFVPNAFARQQISDRLSNTYAGKVIRWLLGLGLLEKSGRVFKLGQRAEAVDLLDKDRVYTTRGYSLFLGDAPPERCVQALQSLQMGKAFSEIENSAGRNSLQALRGLNVLTEAGSLNVSASAETDNSIKIVRNAARQSQSVKFVKDYLLRTGSPEGLEVGDALASEFGLQWSEGSKRRSGGALKRWAIWAFSDELLTDPRQEDLFRSQ